jgi:catechol 2,3-dioxygenase-like lactoylglutathione lyase family enzyme
MARPKIRHIAIFAQNPAILAKFYEQTLEMDIVHSDPDQNAFFVSDGYLTLALLPRRLEGSAPVGINHFGFSVEKMQTIMEKFKAFGVQDPKKRPGDRPYAEYRGADPEGNWFDLSEHGYDTVEVQDARDRKKVSA